jgi:PAS domain S-box-containing protein
MKRIAGATVGAALVATVLGACSSSTPASSGAPATTTAVVSTQRPAPVPPPKGKTALTLRGALSNHNRGSSLEFDLATLDAMANRQATIFEPFVKRDIRFTGIPMSTLLGRAGISPSATKVAMHALDDYRVQFKVADLMGASGLTLAVALMLGLSLRRRASRAFARAYRLLVEEVEEREAAERALRHCEQRFRALVHHASDVFTVVGDDGTIRYQSPAVEQVLAYPAEELIGRPLLDLVHPGDCELVSGLFAESRRRHGGPVVGEATRWCTRSSRSPTRWACESPARASRRRRSWRR